MRLRALFCLLLLPSLASSAGVHSVRYGVATTFNFELYNTDGTLDVDEVDGGAEVAIACDEGAETTATNDFVDEGNFYSIALTAAELQCARVTVVVSATDTNVFYIETYGHPDSQNPELGWRITSSGTAQSNASTTTLIVAAAEAFGDDELIGQLACIVDGAAADECELITDNVGSTDTLTVAQAFETAPTTTSKYYLVKANQGFITVDANGTVDANLVSTDADAITATSIATAAIGADEWDANTEINTEVDTGLSDAGLITVNGVCDSGSTTSCVDATQTTYNDDAFVNGFSIRFATSPITNETACVDSFDGDTGTFTFSPPLTATASAETFYLVVDMGCAVSSVVNSINTGTEQLQLVDPTIVNCQVNTANFAGSTTTLACILTDRDDMAITAASNDLEGKQLLVLSGAQIYEARFINDTTWDSGNSELQLTLSRALPATLADAVTAVIH